MSIAGFVFRRGLAGAASAVPVAGVKEAVAWTTGAVANHFTSHASELITALQTANESAWGALAFSLGDDSALDLLRGGDSRHLREQLRIFLQHLGPESYDGDDKAEFRHHCLEQLRAARRAGLLAGGGIDMPELCRHVGAFAEIANSARLLDAERAALAALAGEFPTNQYPHLRQLLELSPGNGEPFLIVAAEFFFKRQIERSESLHRVVGYDLQIAMLREQRDGQAQIILKMDQQTRELMEHLSLLRRDLRPQDGCSMQNETEKRLVRGLLKQFRELPQTQQEALPDLLGDLGRLAFAAGEFKESHAASSDAAVLAVADPAKAQAHYNAYLAALEDRHWDSALDSLRYAIEIDADRYMPFPFADYRPVRILGAGGFGVAFLCDHVHLAGHVVIKTLQPAQLNRDVSELFREAAVLESLNHPGIVRIRHATYADTQRKHPYLVMDFFDGQSLDDYVQKQGPLPLDHSLDLARQLAYALAAAHDRGILHRDVKPRNVLIRVARAGAGGTLAGHVQVKLIDFGLALRQSGTRTLATGNTLLGSSQTGTLDFSAPEQMGKLPGVKVDKYSDVYSWAKTLRFALFGTVNPRLRKLQALPEALQDLLDDSLAEHRDEIARRPATMKLALQRLAACATPAANTIAATAVIVAAPAAPRTAPPPAPARAVPATLSLEQARQTASERLRHEREGAEQARRDAAEAQVSGMKMRLADQIARCQWLDALRTCTALLSARPDDEEIVQCKAFIHEQLAASNSLGMEFVIIDSGVFTMGSPTTEANREANETSHRVTLTNAFMMAIAPVTQAQWRAVMGRNPSHFKGGDRPVEQVTWDDAISFCKRLSEKEGKLYRLPTEAQWEYACRAGTTTAFHTGNGDGALGEAGWYAGNSGRQTHPVRQKKPNAWGLYDMHGNVWEWCSDRHADDPSGTATDPSGPTQGASRILRGGSWGNDPRRCRSSYRRGSAPGRRYSSLGFRVCLDF
jgi:formylglycine-generating enzyme required for sulfatase activity/tRNA A-37 threonylcarbamoyl transferase component Bud32